MICFQHQEITRNCITNSIRNLSAFVVLNAINVVQCCFSSVLFFFGLSRKMEIMTLLCRACAMYCIVFVFSFLLLFPSFCFVCECGFFFMPPMVIFIWHFISLEWIRFYTLTAFVMVFLWVELHFIPKTMDVQCKHNFAYFISVLCAHQFLLSFRILNNRFIIECLPIQFYETGIAKQQQQP